MSDNMLTTVPAFVFENLSALNATNISISLLVNQIANIDTHAFSGIANIVTAIDLSNNALTHLPLALTELSSLQTLSVSANPIVSLDSRVLSKLSKTLQKFDIYMDKFSQFPTELQMLTAIKSLTIANTFFPFPVSDTSIFQGFENTITTLKLTAATVDRIPAAFCRLTSLHTFILSLPNGLSKNSSTIFDACNHSMPNVTSLTLTYGDLTTLPELAAIFPNLEHLDIHDNRFQVIESRSVAGLHALTFLDISNNFFTRIPSNIAKVANLRTLHAGNNQIDRVGDFDLSSLHNLTKLSLNENPLINISSGAFANNPLLTDIDISRAHLRRIPEALITLKHLRNVHISGMSCSCYAMHYLKSWNITSMNVDAGFCMWSSTGQTVESFLKNDLPKCP